VLRKGDASLIDCSARMAEAALAEVEKAIYSEATSEVWTDEERDQKKEDQRGPLRKLFEKAQEAERQSAPVDWA